MAQSIDDIDGLKQGWLKKNPRVYVWQSILHTQQYERKKKNYKAESSPLFMLSVHAVTIHSMSRTVLPSKDSAQYCFWTSFFNLKWGYGFYFPIFSVHSCRYQGHMYSFVKKCYIVQQQKSWKYIRSFSLFMWSASWLFKMYSCQYFLPVLRLKEQYSSLHSYTYPRFFLQSSSECCKWKTGRGPWAPSVSLYTVKSFHWSTDHNAALFGPFIDRLQSSLVITWAAI